MRRFPDAPDSKRRLQHALLTFFLTATNPLPKSFIFEFCGEDDMSAQTLIVAMLEPMGVDYGILDEELRHWGACRQEGQKWVEKRNDDYTKASMVWVIDYPLIPYHVATEMQSILDAKVMRSLSMVDTTITIGTTYHRREERKASAFHYNYASGPGTMKEMLEAMGKKFESKEGIAVHGYNGDPIGRVTKFDPSDGHYEMSIDGDSLEARMLMEHIAPSVNISFQPLQNGMVRSVALYKGVDLGQEVDPTGGPETPRARRFILKSNYGTANFSIEAEYRKLVWALDRNPDSNTAYQIEAGEVDATKHRFHVHSTVSSSGKGETYQIINIEEIWQ